MIENISRSLNQTRQTIETFICDENNFQLINEAINCFVKSIKSGGKIISCGNGGSMCDANHFAEELTGYYRKKRPALPAIAINDSAHISCVANDEGFDFIFSRFIETIGKCEDTLLAISTSGNSLNVLRACEEAKSKKMKVVGLLGKDGGKLKDKVDVPIIVHGETSDRIQEVHIKIIHIIIEGIERSIYPTNYV